jgi:hypothetical protein
MHHKHSRTLAALLVTAALAVPGAAVAGGPEGAPQPTVAVEGSKPAPVDETAFKVTRDQAVAIARRMFNIPEELGEPSVNVNQSQEGAMWNLNFASSDKRLPQRNFSVGIDAQTGAILNYYRYTTDPSKAQAPLAYTRAEAQVKAQYWLDMLAPALKPALKPVENPMGYGFYGGSSATYQFQWNRIADGYPVRNDMVSITVDARTGELAAFNRGWWRTQGFKLPETLLEQAKAEAAYRQQVPMEVRYQYFQQPGTDTGEWRLVYRPRTDSYPSLNQDGKLVDGSGQVMDLKFLDQVKLVPAADKPYVAPAKPLTREEALALARTASGKAEEPTNANYSEQKEPQMNRAWGFSWMTNLEKGQENVDVRVDIDKGVILNFSQWGPYQPPKEGEQPKFTETQAREVAIQFIRTYRPDLAGNVMIMPSEESRSPAAQWKLMQVQRTSYYVQFLKLQNGIPVSDSSVALDVNAMTGKVQSFWANDYRPQGDFPAATGLIKPEAAMDAFLKSQGLEQSWMQFWAPPLEGKMQQQQDPVLVWAPGVAINVAAIDAKTGAPLDYQGRNLAEMAKPPVDIQGHFAQREIELLWARGIFDLKDGKFNPDQTVTAGELARWLVLARGMQPYPAYDFRMGMGGGGLDMVAAKMEASAAAPYFGAALQNGIILPGDFTADSDPTGPVSRELLALWAVRAMGYGDIASMGNRIAMPFADQSKIGAKYANAVALLHGLQVVSGSETSAFEPQRQSTRGEAAKILFAVASQVRR